MKQKVQFNTRLPKEVRKAYKMSTDHAEVKLDESTEAAILYFCGCTDEKVMSIREKILKAVAELEKGCGFSALRSSSCASLLRSFVGLSQTSRTPVS